MCGRACVRPDLSRLYLAHFVKDYKINWYKCLPWWDGVSCTNLGQQFKGLGHRGQLKIPVRSVTSTRIEVYNYNFAQMLFLLRRFVAYNTWVLSSKVTLKGQLKSIVLCIHVCLDLSRQYFAHSVKDYKIIWYKCLPWWDGVSWTTLGSTAQRSRSHLGVYFFTKLPVNIVLKLQSGLDILPLGMQNVPMIIVVIGMWSGTYKRK